MSASKFGATPHNRLPASNTTTTDARNVPLEVEVPVRLAPRRLPAARREEEDRAVPRRLVEAVELVRDLRDGRRDDGLRGREGIRR